MYAWILRQDIQCAPTFDEVTNVRVLDDDAAVRGISSGAGGAVPPVDQESVSGRTLLGAYG